MLTKVKKILQPKIENFSVFSKYLTIDSFKTHFKFNFKNEKEENNKQVFHYFWLRDHCKCEKCFNHKTQQKIFHILDIPLDIKPKSFEVIVLIVLPDFIPVKGEDEHTSRFCLDWLRNIEFPLKSKRNYCLWNKEKAEKINDNSLSVQEIYKDIESNKRKLFLALLKYGFAYINGVEPSINATENIAKLFFPVQKTHFGEMWDVTNNYQFKDTAYTNSYLAPHNDNTYWTEAGGLMLFHIIYHDGDGGETLLVDGFKAATNLKISSPHSYEILTKNMIEAEYIEEDVHYSSLFNVIKENSYTNQLLQVQFNVYDRALFNSLPKDKILEFYKAYLTFAKEIMNAENELKIKLNPGTILVVDNWRILHGRRAFTGKRKLTGCYISRAEWLSKARNIGFSIL